MKIKCFECRKKVICEIEDPVIAGLALKRKLGVKIQCPDNKCKYINEL